MPQDPPRSTSVFDLVQLVQRLACTGRCVTHGLRFCLCDRDVQHICLESPAFSAIQFSRDGAQIILYSVYSFLSGCDDTIVNDTTLLCPVPKELRRLQKFLFLRFYLDLPLGQDEMDSYLDKPLTHTFESDASSTVSHSLKSRSARQRANRAARKKLAVSEGLVQETCPMEVTSDYMEVDSVTSPGTGLPFGGFQSVPYELRSQPSGVYHWSPV